MICLKCGNEIKDEEQICSKCGYNKNTISKEDNPFGIKNQGIYNPNAVDKDVAQEKLDKQKQFHELVEIYIGPKYYNFKKGSFSWCAFFFGPLYFLYRKLYAVAIVLFLMLGGISTFFNVVYNSKFGNIKNIEILIRSKGYLTSMIIYFSIMLIFYIFLGVIFKKFYFNECMERVAMIKKKNPDLGFNQLAELVKQKGGTNILAPLLVVVIPLVIMVITMILAFILLGKMLYFS